MKNVRRFAALIILVASACAPTISRSVAASAASDIDKWLDAVAARGVRVERVGEVEQPFLSVIGQMVQVNSEDVQAFGYPSAADMEAQASRISPDGGTVGTSNIHWIGTPHFFKQGKLLVLYVGENDDLLRILTATLGRQFAGK
jgi:hypothetical protein